MRYSQITQDERYQLHSLRNVGLPVAAIARILGRHRSTIGREFRRNRRTSHGYDPYLAQGRAEIRRSWSRRNRRLTRPQWTVILQRLRQDWSPEQVAGWLRVTGQFRVSTGTIYRYLGEDRLAGGELYRLLRHGGRRRRRYGSGAARAGRGQLGRCIRTRPAVVERRRQLGHWELDTVLGQGSPDCLLTMVERVTGFTLVGKLPDRTAAAVNACVIRLIRAQPHRVRTITADNGSELAGYRVIEERTGTRFFFALPYHAWQRGTSENTNGLIRQYARKGQSLASLTQRDCTRIARKLNTRPRKRHGYRTPEACYVP
jgi:transposase, IS30 family